MTEINQAFGQPIAKRLTLFFSAGCLGALANSLAVWLFGMMKITTAFGVEIAPTLTPGWLYPRIVWGGIWGFLFFLPPQKSQVLIKGLLLSLGPTLVQLFVVFPLKAQKGVMGLELGGLTPLFVVIFNGIWGIITSYWITYVRE